ncbi:MAG: ATP-binding cassette domain-containing protein [Proteobacteria bacterium]|nr:ATP-binding cassette domain-containing protein [Pseudomonadota bacterium]
MKTKDDAFLNIQNLTFSYKGLELFKDFCFSWPKDAKRMGILGPNGSGKSTLFKIISGEISTKVGRIYFQEENISNLTFYERNRKGISKTFQHPSPFESLTVFQNVLAATLEHHPKNKREDITHTLLKFFHLQEKATHLPESLNLLELRLLEMARAFATNPKLILLDECMVGFSNNDLTIFSNILKSIQEQTNVKIALIEHNLHFLKEFCDYLCVLHLGKCIVQGSVDECFNNTLVQDIYFPNSRNNKGMFK